MHDNKWSLDLHLMPHMGIIDWADFADALVETCFDGVFSLEISSPVGLADQLFDELNVLYVNVANNIINGGIK